MKTKKNPRNKPATKADVDRAYAKGTTDGCNLAMAIFLTVIVDKFNGIDATYDTESYNNGVKNVPSYLLVPYVITKDNLQVLVDTGLYQWDADKKYLESTATTT